LNGKKAFVITDERIQSFGYLQLIEDGLRQAGIESQAFTGVEPDPCLETAHAAAAVITAFEPDWVIALGGGSCQDVAKAAYFMYAQPDTDLIEIDPTQDYGLHDKAHFLTIPTTAGSGAEVTAAAVLLDTAICRKLEIASYDLIPDITIIDPRLTAQMPPYLTADTGIDALSHAVEGYSATWSNDFSDALCLQATRLIFEYLPRAVLAGVEDPEAREKMANAATMAGLGMTNSHIAAAHAMGHSLGALFGLPHGRATGISLPYTIEFTGKGDAGRYAGLAQAIGCHPSDERQAAEILADCTRELMRKVNMPVSLREAGLPKQDLEEQLEALCERAMNDTSLAMARRVPTWEEMEKLFWYAYEGKKVDF
jgi:alcohol dehydrogenase class IV